MEKVNITLAFDQEKLDALEFYLKKEKTTPQRRLDRATAFEIPKKFTPNSSRKAWCFEDTHNLKSMLFLPAHSI